MLQLVENKSDKISAQRIFATSLRKVWKTQENRLIVWRPNYQNLEINHNGVFWFAAESPGRNQKTPRYWNSIGKYQSHGGLQIAVEINIPTESNSQSISGFFARDEQTDTVYLLHDGGVGGGRLGIGRENFLAWYNPRLVPVEDSKGNIRFGIIVTAIESKRIGIEVAHFAKAVADFKQAVVQGKMENAYVQESKQTYVDFFHEFSGRKKGQRKQEFEYISRHGEIVDALSEWRKKRISLKPSTSERIVKNVYIDLGVEDASGNLTELYEVKPNVERQSLYTAIGQIMVHDDASFKNLQRFIVLPESDEIPREVQRALKRLNIKTLRFVMTPDGVSIVE